MAILSIDGVPMPDPTSYDVTMANLQSSNSGRNDEGVMIIETIRTDVASINIGWEMLTNSELATIMTAIAPDELTVTYFYGANKTATMYVGDRKVTMRTATNNDHRWDVSFSLIEY